MSEPTIRKPALTHRAMLNLLRVASLAQADADLMDTAAEREEQRAIYDGCDYIRSLAAWWSAKHGVDWPTQFKSSKKETTR